MVYTTVPTSPVTNASLIKQELQLNNSCKLVGHTQKQIFLLTNFLALFKEAVFTCTRILMCTCTLKNTAQFVFCSAERQVPPAHSALQPIHL